MNCGSCGTDNEESACFCRHCGSALSKVNWDSVSTRSFCHQCGSEINAGITFCGKCGAHLCTAPQSVLDETLVPQTHQTETIADSHGSAVMLEGTSPLPRPKTSQHLPTAPALSPAKAATVATTPSPSSGVLREKAKASGAAPTTQRISKRVAWLSYAIISLFVIGVFGGGVFIFLSSDGPLESNTTAVVVTPPRAVQEAGVGAIRQLPVVKAHADEIEVQTQQPTPGRNPVVSVPVVRAAGRPPKTERSSVFGSAVIQPHPPDPQSASEVVSPDVRTATPTDTPPTQLDNRPRTWRESFTKDIEKCQQEGFLNRVVCVEKTKWKYCQPDLWGRVPECPGTTVEQHGKQ